MDARLTISANTLNAVKKSGNYDDLATPRAIAWTPEMDDRLRAFVKTDKYASAIAPKMGLSTQQVYNRCNSLDLKLGYAAVRMHKPVATTIIRTVAAEYGVTVDELEGMNRAKRLVVPRHICMWLIREIGRHSFPEIGRYFSNRDHTTIMYGCEMVKTRRITEPAYYAHTESLRDRLEMALMPAPPRLEAPPSHSGETWPWGLDDRAGV